MISVVVVTWDAAELTLRCLRSLADERVDGHEVEIIVVDNGSQDDTVARVSADHPKARIVRQGSNTGFAAGANAGIRHARGDILVLLNNDAVATPGLLGALAAPFETVESLGATTGTVILEGRFVRDDTSPDLVARDGAGWRRNSGGIELVNSTGNQVDPSGNGYDRDWLIPVRVGIDTGESGAPIHSREPFGFNGGCAALSRRALRDVGLFAESLFMYYEDTDLSWRLRERGWRIMHAPRAITHHAHAASSGTRSRFFLDHNEANRLRVAMMHGPWPMVARAWTNALARAVLGPQRPRRVRILVRVASEMPRLLASRRRFRRRASVPQHAIVRTVLPD